MPSNIDYNRAYLDLKKRIAMYEEIFDRCIQGVYIINKDEEITWLNSVIEEQDGVSRKNLVGKKDSKIWKIYNLNDTDSVSYTIKTGEQSAENIFTYINPNTGQEMRMFSRSYPFYYENKLEYVYSIGYYLEYAEKHLHKISEYLKKIENSQHKNPNNTTVTLYDVVGSCPKIQALIEAARKIALNNSPVMLYGKTGTGKEIFAQGIHNASLRNKEKFVAINCAAIPENLLESTLFGSVKGAFTGAITKEGLLEAADGGTLFLDELDSLPLITQGKILRVLQESQASRIGSNKTYSFNCRIISATNKDPRKLVNDGTLRDDLYFRLAVINLEIPPLSERECDIEELTQYFINKYNLEYHLHVNIIEPEVFDVFHAYDWPGNVRELQHVVEHMMNFIDERDDTLAAGLLPPYLKVITRDKEKTERSLFNSKEPLSSLMEYVEKGILEAALKRNHWNITQTAKDLNIRREGLHYRIKKYHITKS